MKTTNKKEDVDSRDLFEEDSEAIESECDEWDENQSFEEEHKWDGLDEGFSSWQDYYNYMYG